MPNAKKCDRCGIYFEEKSNLHGFKLSEYVKVFGTSVIYGDYRDTKEVKYDLCHDCMKELNKWFRGKKDDR